MSGATFEPEVVRIRELSKIGRYQEALAAAKGLEATAPQNRDVLYLIAANQRCLNRIPEALATLQRLEEQHPRFSLLYQERGHCYATLRNTPLAIDAFLRGVDLNPALQTSWIMLERLYRMTGELQRATAAAEHISALRQLPSEIVRAGSLFSDGDLSAAEGILRAYLRVATHVEALRLLGRIEQQRGGLDEAEIFLQAALDLAPNYRAARLEYARVLIDRQKYQQAEEVIEKWLEHEPGNRDYLLLQAAVFAGLGRYERAIIVYRELLAGTPDSPGLHVALGHCLKSVSRQQDAVDSYQTAAAVQPGFGDAYWSLANLKTYRFSDDEISRMRSEEAGAAARPVDRYHLCFALGKAYEDRNEFAESWGFYERGNRLKREEGRYHPEITETEARQQIEICTERFFATRVGFGLPNPDPIFIVGLPRSGSTLIEQILASHSQVEGTQELPDVLRIVQETGRTAIRERRPDPREPCYPDVLADLTAEDFRGLGVRYLADTR